MNDQVVIVPPDTALIHAVAKLTNALSRLELDDPLRVDLADAVRSLLCPRLELSVRDA